jgi:general secretion pathway protein I
MQTQYRPLERSHRRLRPHQRGFTLIEAIVAMVLIATTGMALFGWLNSNIITLTRVQEVNAESEATQNALDFMATINPMAQPEGQVELGAYKLSWQASPSNEPRDGAGYPYGIGLYQLALYDTQVSLHKADRQTWFNFTVKQIGYKKVRSLFIDR